jgi:uncharacterized protein
MNTSLKNPKNIFFITASIFLTALTVIVAVLAIRASGMISSGDSYPEKTFSVQGSAEVKAKPDTASFSVTIEEQAKNSEEATEVLNKKAETIISAIESLGVKEEDITTNNYSVYEKFEWIPRSEGGGNKQTSVGWTSQQSFSFDIADIEKAPKVLEELNKHNVRVNGPAYRVAHPEAAKETARTKAIENAKSQAEKLANDLDVELGEMVSYYEVNNGYEAPYPIMHSEMAFDGMATKSSTPVLPTGEDSIMVTVELLFEFE